MIARHSLIYVGSRGFAAALNMASVAVFTRLAPVESYGTYLYVLARSAAADIYKRPSSRPFLPDTDTGEQATADGVDQILDCMIVREALESLSPEQAEVIRLGQEAGLTQSQIAERLNLPLGTVKTRSFHGMRALRSALLERGFHGV